MNTELTRQQPTGMEFLRDLGSKTNDSHAIEAISKAIVDMQRMEWEREDRQDEIDFGEALSKCQAAIGQIKPDVERKLKSGATMNWFASYPHLDATVRPIYLEHGFSISYSEVNDAAQGRLGVKATLMRGRTSRDYYQYIAIAEGNQATTRADLDASSSSRCMRYLLIKMFNIAVAINKDEMAIMADENVMEWIKTMEESPDPKELYKRWKWAKAEAKKLNRPEAIPILNQKYDQIDERMATKK